MMWPCFHTGCLGEARVKQRGSTVSELSSEDLNFCEWTIDTRSPLSTIRNSQNPLFGRGSGVLAALSNFPAFLYQVPVSHRAPSLPKTSPAAQREDSSHLAEVWAMLHAVDGGNPPGMRRAERGIQMFSNGTEKDEAVTSWQSHRLGACLAVVLYFSCSQQGNAVGSSY